MGNTKNYSGEDDLSHVLKPKWPNMLCSLCLMPVCLIGVCAPIELSLSHCLSACLPVSLSIVCVAQNMSWQ